MTFLLNRRAQHARVGMAPSADASFLLWPVLLFLGIGIYVVATQKKLTPKQERDQRVRRMFSPWA